MQTPRPSPSRLLGSRHPSSHGPPPLQQSARGVLLEAPHRPLPLRLPGARAHLSDVCNPAADVHVRQSADRCGVLNSFSAASRAVLNFVSAAILSVRSELLLRSKSFRSEDLFRSVSFRSAHLLRSKSFRSSTITPKRTCSFDSAPVRCRLLF